MKLINSMKKQIKMRKYIFCSCINWIRSSILEFNARGTFFGLTRKTSKEDIIKATLDSLSYQTYELINVWKKTQKQK